MRKTIKKIKQKKSENQQVNDKSPNKAETGKPKSKQSKATQGSKISKSKNKNVEVNSEMIVVESEEVYDDADSCCEICMLGNIKGYHWYGCDGCPAWYHYECLPHNQQVLVDISTIT